MCEQEQPQHISSAGTRNIAIAVDSSFESERIAAWTAENVARHGDVVHALHVVPAMLPRPSYRAYGDGMIVSAPAPNMAELHARQEDMRADLTRRFQHLFEHYGAPPSPDNVGDLYTRCA